MPTLIAPPGLGQVIKFEGKCYEQAGNTNADVDITTAAEFETCEECESGSSGAPASAAPSSAAPSSATSSGEESSADPCESVDCSGDPSMKISVSNMGATEMISWCGETWNLPDENGMVKCVCPTSYTQNKYTPTTLTVADQVAQNYWSFGTSLTMRRAYRKESFYSAIRRSNIMQLNDGGPRIDRRYDYSNVYGPQPPITVYSSLNLILGAPLPTPSDYLITGDFFGSHTISGITYSWAKGNDWP